MKALLWLLIFTTCQPAFAYKADWPNAEWTEILSKALNDHGQEMLKAKPKDSETFGFKPTEAKEFYIKLISSMARFESGFRPEVLRYECASKCIYKKCRKVKGRGYCMLGGHEMDGGLVISRGLLQISLQSAQSYGCRVTRPQELHEVSKNIECSVKILNRWISADQMIGTSRKGGGRYWSVLRDKSDSRRKIIAKVKAL